MTNTHLDAALQRAGWTPERLAAAINERLRADGQHEHAVHPKTPWKWLKGVAPHPPLPGYIADVLSERVGDTLRAADLGLLGAQRVDRTVPADDGLDASYDQAGADAVLRELDAHGAADSRRFALLRGPSLTQHAHLWLVSDVANARPLAEGAAGAPSRLEAFRTVIETLRRLDDVEGGASVLPWSARETQWAIEALRSTPEARRPAMYRIVAELAELTGWSAVDGGQHALAQRYLLVALHASQAIGDREHGAYILALLGLNASLAGQHREAVTIFESAQVGLRNAASLTVQSIVTGLEARTRAAADDAAGFRATIARGTAVYERARAADGPPWAYWLDGAAEFPMQIENGRALTMVGEPHRAIEVLTPQVAAAGDYLRDAVLIQAYLAEAHQDAGNLDEAAAYADLARTGIAAGVQSPRTEVVLAGLTG